MTNWELRVDDIDEPTPSEGQVLTKVLACGICGSDLHLVKHGEESRRLSDEMAGGRAARSADRAGNMFEPSGNLVMGHEFCCEVVEVGPGVNNLAVGDVVVSMPVTFDAGGVHAIGFSNTYPGGYAELMVLNELLAIKVPTGLPHRMAALTEPLAVGVHAVAKSKIAVGEAAVVIGLGPVGLACIAAMKMLGIGPIIGVGLLPGSPRARRAPRLRRGGRSGRRGADRRVATGRREQAARHLRGRRRAGHDRAGDADGAAQRPRAGRRRLHAAGHDPPDARHRQGAEHPVRARIRPARVRRVARRDRRGEGRPRAAAHRFVSIDEVPQAFVDLGNPELHAKIIVEP